MTSVGEIERDIAATRARLHDTIDEIQSRLTVSGIVDEVLGQAGVPRLTGSGHDFVFGIMRRNPLPVMVAAAAVGFLIHRRNKRMAARPYAVVADAGGPQTYARGPAELRAGTPEHPLGPKSLYPGDVR